ncbi:MAG: AraC family transcriptional regulator [Spirochaetes bacterium]|nr:MAG: AraC family transcriptional regulator [Spirochaetota bacterium]
MYIIKKKLFPLCLITLLLPVFSMLCGCTASGKKNPVAVKGSIDFTEWNFSKDGTAGLDGEWEFYRMSFLSPDDFRKSGSHAGQGYMNVPGGWNPGRKIYSPNLANGYATYRLRIIMGGEQSNSLGLRLGFVRSAYRLYVNGKLIHSAGTPGTSAASTVSNFSDDIVQLPVTNSNYEVILQAANYHFPAGGIIGRVDIGSMSRLMDSRQLGNIFTIFRACILVLLGLYQLFIFSMQPREYQYLFLGLICLCLVPEISGNDKNFWSSVISFLTWSGSYRWAHFSYLTGGIFIIAYLRRIFPLDVPRAVAWGFTIIISTACIITAVIPGEYINHMLLPYHLISVSLLFLYLYILIRATVMRRENVFLVKLGLFIILLFSLFDMSLPLFFYRLISMGIPAVSLRPAGTLALCVLQVADMTRDFIVMKHHVTHLSMDNDDLKAAIKRMKADSHVLTDSIGDKINVAIEYLAANYASDISRENLAQSLGLHPDNFSRYFKMHTGKKYNEYLNDLRITEAQRLLAETNTPIIDIAMNVGFRSLRTFNHAFMSGTGRTPGDFRKG